MCAAMGADWIGLNFHPVSPRFVESVRAAEIVEALPASTQAVGLFVDRPVEEIKRLAHDVGFRIVQLHGNELPESYLAGQQGGTGHAIDDAFLDLLPPLPHLILAGGLTPENVADRARRVRPWMVDVASGVESAPGQKDRDKVARFIENARSVTIAT